MSRRRLAWSPGLVRRGAASPSRRVAVVGAGVYTALGPSVAANWSAMLASRGGVRPIRRFDARHYPVRIGAEVDLEGSGPGLYSRLTDLTLAEALGGLELGSVPPERIGVFVGAEAIRPDMGAMSEQLLEDRLPDLHELALYHPAAITRRIATHVGARGAVATLSTSCTSAGQALGEALLALRRGEVDLALVGGVDVLVHPLMVTGFSRLGALSTRNDEPERASRPFDVDRDGFVLGEGAGLVVLATPDLAEVVGPVLGWLSGYGCSANAWRITDSPPDGRGAAAAMRAALVDAGRRPEDVVYVNAHGTSTRQNDVSESRGIRAALGDQASRARVSSTKSMTAHMVAAGGIVEAIFALEAVRRQVAPPTINLDRPDPECDLRHVPWQPAELEPGVAMSNAFGFGGSNASVVVEAP